MLTSGAQLGGRYRLHRPLGSGGMGDVWQAADLRLERWVAVKLMRTDADPHQTERFRREALSMAAASHPGTVQVFDVGTEAIRIDRSGTTSTIVYIVMEMLPGPSLGEELGRHGPLPVGVACDTIAQVARTLVRVHGSGVIHRDLKPSNLVYDTDRQIRVLDFGIARLERFRGAGLTSGRSVMGSLHYLSPEQAAGRPVSSASDIYSLGCVMFELLTGRPPFVGGEAVSFIYRHISEPAPRVGSIRQVPAHVDELVDSMLAKDPDRRPDAAEVQRRLATPPDVRRQRARADGRAVHAAPSRSARWSPVLGVLAAVMALTTAGGGFVALGAHHDATATNQARQVMAAVPAGFTLGVSLILERDALDPDFAYSTTLQTAYTAATSRQAALWQTGVDDLDVSGNPQLAATIKETGRFVDDLQAHRARLASKDPQTRKKERSAYTDLGNELLGLPDQIPAVSDQRLDQRLANLSEPKPASIAFGTIRSVTRDALGSGRITQEQLTSLRDARRDWETHTITFYRHAGPHAREQFDLIAKDFDHGSRDRPCLQVVDRLLQGQSPGRASTALMLAGASAHAGRTSAAARATAWSADALDFIEGLLNAIIQEARAVKDEAAASHDHAAATAMWVGWLSVLVGVLSLALAIGALMTRRSRA